MSGVNTGILINAYPLTAEQIAEIETKIFTTPGNTYAFLADTRELCYAFNFGVDGIKELAWHQAWELSIEDSVYVKRIYKKKSQREYYLWKTLYKNSLDEPWPDDPEMTQLDPAVIELDGDILNIFDESGLATSATIFVNGVPMHTVAIEGETKEPLDPTFNHYGIIPEGYVYGNDNGNGGGGGDPFPPLTEFDHYECPNGLIYRYSEGQWRVDESLGYVSANADGSLIILESINGAPVTTIVAFGHAGLPMFGSGDDITTITIPKSVVKIQRPGISGATSLVNIIYTGTMEQWSAVELEDGWNNNCPAFTVSCTDGPIAIPAYNS